jgi:prephenate dehydrogenase
MIYCNGLNKPMTQISFSEVITTMAAIQISILGLGRLGTSIGLALKRYMQDGGKHQFEITGYDPVGNKGKTAKTLNAIDQVKPSIEEAVQNQNIIIISLPYGEVEGVYRRMGSYLISGAVILDLSTLKQNNIQAAEKHLPQGAHLVCATPIINSKYLFENLDETERASADYFDQGVMMLMPSVTCVEDAVTLANDFTSILGATAQYFDPTEHDLLIHSSEILPSLLGVALFSHLRQSDSWDDKGRLTNSAFGATTHFLFDRHPDDLMSMWTSDPEQMTRNINEIIKTLMLMRDLIRDRDHDSLRIFIDNNSRAYETWINKRNKNTWRVEQPKVPSMSDTIGGAMFGNFFKRGRDKNKNKD